MKHHATKTYGAVRVWLHHSWSGHLLEVSGQLQAPSGLPPGNEPPVPAGWGWVNPRTDLEAMDRGKSLVPARKQTQALQPVAHRYADLAVVSGRTYLNQDS